MDVQKYAEIIDKGAHVRLETLLFRTFVMLPEQTAIIDGNRTITYRELEKRVKDVQIAISKLISEPATCVAVCMPRSIELVVSCLAILACGCTYVPVDPLYPFERQKYILDNCGCAIVIVNDIHSDYDFNIPILSFTKIKNEHNSMYKEIEKKSETAYIIYTSGSTGAPKGVMIGHSAIINTLLWMKETFSVGQGDVIALKTSIGFTDSIVELFLPILCGATIKVIDDRDITDMGKLLVSMEGVTIAQFVPPLLKMLFAYIRTRNIENPLHKLRWVLNGGQAIYMDLVCEAAKILPNAVIANTYGMTESAVYATYHLLSPNDTEALIGSAVANMKVYLLDGMTVIDEIDKVGEICLSGIGLMLGYWNNPDLTEKKMPVHESLGGRLYHTGDFGKWMASGELAYCGRLDDQIKVSGKRVELNEVSAAVSTCLPEAHTVVVAQADADGGSRIICFYSGTAIDEGLLRAELLRSIPEYMIPVKYIYVSEIPLTPNGKVDKKALLSCKQLNDSERIEMKVIENVWRTVLPDVEKIKGDFFELGGTSLIAMKMLAMLEILGYHADYDKFRENPTLEHLWEVINSER